jgi:SAM-dependent methyltransferase
MASYKSQFVPPRRMEDRAPTTRLPQRSITPTTITTITSGAPATSQSKLQKRRPSRDEPAFTGRAPASQKAPVRKGAPLPRSNSTVALQSQHPSMPASRTAPQVQTSRLPKLEVPANIRTPSLASGSSASTIESPRANVLRRKQTSVGVASNRQPLRVRDGSMSSQDERQPGEGIPGGYKDPFSETVLGISLPSSSTLFARSEPEVDSFDRDLYGYDFGSTEILHLPTPQYALSATPSTRYTGSPGPFSVSSTPTSMSSYSPGTALSRNSHRTKQASPLQSRPPVTRHRTPDELTTRNPHTLSTVRESSTSSSSASTVVTEAGKPKDKQSSNGLATLPQSPPMPNSDSAPAERAHVQAPPEFAHLVDQSPVSLPATRRPARPSRDGTPEIMGIRGPSPIVQSNMLAFPSTHRRTSSTESKSGPGPAARSRAGVPTKALSRLPSPGPSVSRGPSRGPTPETQGDREARRSSTLPAPVSAPSPSKTSRFGFFSRRTKTDPAPPAKTENKLQRKGPVAGTGHEGYGKYSARGRSGSSISAGSIGRSASAGTTSESLDRTPSTRKSSMTSTASTDMDDFFLNRLAPRVIRGTGSSTELSRSPEPMHSSSSLDVPRSGYDLKKTSSNTSQNTMETRPTLLPSAMPDTVRGQSPMKKTPLGRRRPSESDDDSKRSFLPALASRRTSRAVKTPESSALSSNATGKLSMDKGRKDSAGDISEGKEGRWLKSSKKGKAEKEQPKTSKKWNFFQRAHAAPRADTPAAAPTPNTTSAPISRSVAHYALMDQTGLDMNDIEELMKEANTQDEGTESALSDDEPERRERMQSMLLPPKPILSSSSAAPVRSASPKVTLRKRMQREEQQPQKLFLNTNIEYAPRSSARQSIVDLTPMDLSSPSSPFSPPYQMNVPVVSSEIAPVQPPAPAPAVPASFIDTTVSPETLPPPGPLPMNPPPRPSRLPQVGRIPQVVSTRRPARGPSSQSFSRPFATPQPRPTAVPRTSFDSIGSMVATAGLVEPYPILHGLSALTHGSAIATMSPLSDESRRSEFFKFPPRKDSEVSYSSSSGIWSFAPAFGTAVVPGPGAPLSEDELWNEYDDLLDEVLSPVTSRTSQDHGMIRSQHPSLEPLPLQTKVPQQSSQSECSVNEVSYPSLHLRRSRLLAVLHQTQSPISEVSFNDFLQDYGERKISVVDPVTGRLSLPSSPRLSTGSAAKRTTRSSLPTDLPASARQSKVTIASRSSKDHDSAAGNRYRDSRLMEIAETQSDGLVSVANLRFAALMCSKFFTFGRVLFSPVHFNLNTLSDDRVLVIDGLGKDWSHYCALTYPEAMVYNVGPGMSSTTPNDGTAEPLSTLNNHRHICHDSLTNALPFPMHFFACVVLRFPTALPSSVHRFVLSEAKRVLRPGGYLEFSVLDLDLVNMGNRARRAVRGLKMRMQVADECLSLRNISDEIMAGLGRKGFIECNRCVVGIPVAGNLPVPDETKVSATKRTGSNASSKSKKNTTTLSAAKGPKPEVSFSDLLNVSQPSESTDNGITDMVARVGRWWYSRCYESIVLPEAGEPGAESSGNVLENSIWRDEALINECEKRGTSFKMLIGYAQKPEIGVRRTVSV